MDTSEAGMVATDGGEAMAEVDDNEEEMQGDDTSASSSSSSPEELPVSDAGEYLLIILSYSLELTTSAFNEPDSRPKLKTCLSLYLTTKGCCLSIEL